MLMSDKDDGGKKVELSPIEEQAQSRGHKPKDQWEGDPNEWVDAATFVRMGELMDKISSQSRELKEVKGVISEFKKHSQERDVIALKKAKALLLEEKATALEGEDFNKVVQIDEDIKEADRQIETTNNGSGNDAPGTDPFKAYYEDVWVKNNDWYQKSTAMRGAADNIGDDFMAANPNASPEDLFKHVTKEIKEEFAHKFKNPNRDEPGAVGSSKGKGQGNRNSRLDLTDDEYAVGMKFVKQDLYKSIEEYAAELNGK